MPVAEPATGPPPSGWRRLLVERRRPPSIAANPNSYWLVVATVCVGAFMGQLDASIVVLALPSLQASFHSSLGSVEWVSLAYLLVLVATVTAVGRFADMTGRKLLYLYGFGLFVVGSALCALAPNLPFLDAFRVIQGFGAAMLQANSVALIVQAVPPAKLGRSLGVQGAAQALGLALGPALGGLLLGLGGWRLIFLINIPAGIIGIALGWFFLPRSRHLSERQPIDFWGIGTFVVAITGLLLAVSFGNEAGWASLPILADLVVTAVFTTLFIRHELHDPAPMMRLAIFKVAAFSAGISSGLLSYLCLFGVLFVLPFYLEFSGHLRPGAAGLQLLVLPLALGITAPLTGILADRVGARSLTVSGMIVVGIALLAMAAHPPGTGLLLIELAAAGIGLGMFTPPNNAAIMTAAPRQQAGMASGILNMTRGLGTSMGVALTALVFGLAAGTSAARAMAPGAATRGLAAAALFLSISAFLAAALAGLRGNAPLDHDPASLVEG